MGLFGIFKRRSTANQSRIRTKHDVVSFFQQATKDADLTAFLTDVVGRVELRRFGVFEVKKRKPRPARNPRTGEQVMVGERVTVTFKPGRVMEERVAMGCGGGAEGDEEVIEGQ